jgi:FixJ family two-component response regulator
MRADIVVLYAVWMMQTFYPGGWPRMQQPVILVVDDEPELCAILTEALTSRGATTEAIMDPCLVADEIRARSYDVILLDLCMPRQSGLDVLATVRRLAPDVKVIMMTGHADTQTAIEALRLGAFDFREKPFALDLLFHTVTRALDTQRIELENRRMLEDLRRSRHELLQSKTQLERTNQELRDTNATLAVLMRNIKRARRETEEEMLSKIRSLIIPTLETLRQDRMLCTYKPQLTTLLEHIEDLTTGLRLDVRQTSSLSFSELRVASMLKSGMTSKEIAVNLHVSLETVKSHRKNIRRKLKLVGSKDDLRTHLRAIESSPRRFEPRFDA